MEPIVLVIATIARMVNGEEGGPGGGGTLARQMVSAFSACLSRGRGPSSMGFARGRGRFESETRYHPSPTWQSAFRSAITRGNRDKPGGHPWTCLEKSASLRHARPSGQR